MQLMQNPLKEYRKGKKLSLEAFGAAFGVNKTTVMRWEGGNIPLERLSEISSKTGISPKKLRPDVSRLFTSPANSRGAA